MRSKEKRIRKMEKEKGKREKEQNKLLSQPQGQHCPAAGGPEHSSPGFGAGHGMPAPLCWGLSELTSSPSKWESGMEA